MQYHFKQLTNGRWGIYINDQLTATIGCKDTCQRIVHFLENRSFYQEAPAPALKEKYAVTQYFHSLKLKP